MAMKTQTRSVPKTYDPLIVDLERLQELASAQIIRRGVTYFRENRVTDLVCEDRRIRALVEGSNPDVPYSVEIHLDSDNELNFDCTCPFDWEPVCKHAVAVLLKYAAEQSPRNQQLQSATERAIYNRVQRGRTEVQIEHLEGEPWFGAWLAHTVSDSRSAPRKYRVQIRSLLERTNDCTCPDFALNQLGTCKHIEAVMFHLRKRYKSRFEQGEPSPPPVSLVYLAWDAPRLPVVRLIRATSLKPDLVQILNRHFDADGTLKGELTDAAFRLHDEVANRDDLLFGEDVLSFAQRAVQLQARRTKAEYVRDQIRLAGDRMPGLQARLYPYQVEGVAFLASTGRALLADDMGLGKTIQAIAATCWLMHNDGVRRTLVVCPASIKHQWKRSVERFTNLRVVVAEGNAPSRACQYRALAPFTIVNYETLLRDLSVIQGLVAPDVLIVDEAQRIRNWRTKTAEAVKAVPSRHTFVLTGTPLENRLEDLYSIMQLVDPHILGPLWRFMSDFHIVNERGKVTGFRNLSKLRRRTAPVMLRRDRELVSDQLPPRIKTQLDVPMTTRQVELHNAGLSAAASIASIARKRPLTPGEEKRLMSALQQVRMACDAAGLVDKETVGSPKLEELEHLLQELVLGTDRKAVIFSEWEKMTAMAEEVARKLGLGTARLHGGVPTHKRDSLLESFRKDSKVQLLFSTDTGSTGLDLQHASLLINLDLPWNPAFLEQRIARLHRLGQKEPVQVILLLADNSYEQRVALLLESKRELFMNVVSPDARADVVEASKPKVEWILETLRGPNEPAIESETAAQVQERGVVVSPPAKERTSEPAEPTQVPHLTEDEDPTLCECVTRLKARLGNRIERILRIRNDVLVVVDVVDATADQAAGEETHKNIPVAVIDTRTATSLERLGTVADAQTIYVRPAEQSTSTVSSLMAQAQRKMKAAQVLLEGGCIQESLGLIGTAMLFAAAARAGHTSAPQSQGVAVWLYGEAVPQGGLSAEDAAAILRTLSLAEGATFPPAAGVGVAGCPAHHRITETQPFRFAAWQQRSTGPAIKERM